MLGLNWAVIGDDGFEAASPASGVNLSYPAECGVQPVGSVKMTPGTVAQKCLAFDIDARDVYNGKATTFAPELADYDIFWSDPLFAPEK
ncbi:hypothetical protein ACFRJ9_05995 [Paenarthrobacter sp. NPDC056912]|uniref:hypothetical protein n=1 Tax=Paenarthrobacter sp. NPDC056912 TaxID=3345965 RepID=UPI00366ABD76